MKYALIAELGGVAIKEEDKYSIPFVSIVFDSYNEFRSEFSRIVNAVKKIGLPDYVELHVGDDVVGMGSGHILGAFDTWYKCEIVLVKYRNPDDVAEKIKDIMLKGLREVEHYEGVTLSLDVRFLAAGHIPDDYELFFKVLKEFVNENLNWQIVLDTNVYVMSPEEAGEFARVYKFATERAKVKPSENTPPMGWVSDDCALYYTTTYDWVFFCKGIVVQYIFGSVILRYMRKVKPVGISEFFGD